MRIIDAPENNITLTPPDSWDEEKDGPCESARAQFDGSGFVVTFAFEPAEFAALLRGGKVKLKVFGGAFPPVALWVAP